MRHLIASLVCVIFLTTAAGAQTPAPTAAVTATTTTAPVVSAPLPPGTDQGMPAAAPAAASNNDWMQYRNPYAGEQNDLNNPNRTTDEILAWSQKVVTDAMTFTPDDLNAKILDVKRSFDATGWGEYSAYIRSAKILELVRDQRYTLSTIVNGDASVMNAAAVSGSYRWLVTVPLLVTFLHTDPGTGQQQSAGNGNYVLTLQVGRVSADATDAGLAVQSWKIAQAAAAAATP